MNTKAPSPTDPRIITAVLLLLWILFGYIGAKQRMESRQFEEYVGTVLKGFDQPAGAMLGQAPGFIFIINSIAAATAFAVLAGVAAAVTRASSTAVRRLLTGFTAVLLVISAGMAGTGFMESLTWGFELYALHHLLWFLFVFYALWYLWNILHPSRLLLPQANTG